MKKMIAMILLISIFCTSLGNAVSAHGIESENSKERILREYQEQTLELKTNKDTRNNMQENENKTFLEIQKNAVAQLIAAGYEAYSVTSDSFATVESRLQTDLNDMGLNPNSAYIVVIEGENLSSSNSRSTAGGSFNYTYSGKSYKLRYLTVTAADDSLMSKASSVDLLKSSSQTAIENCLDTLISACISSASPILATVASICGLSVSNFSPTKSSTLTLNAGTNWTRKYTQVWNTSNSLWYNGCYVEYASIYTYISGLYYSAKTNQYENISETKIRATHKSSQYENEQWAKQYGVLGFLNASIYPNQVGNVQYKYGGTTKITHRENF